MYALLRRYTFDPGQAGDVARELQQGLVPLLRRTPGFAVFYWLDGDGTGAALAVYDDVATARYAIELADEYIAQHLGGIAVTPEVAAGDVLVHATSGL